MKQDRRHLCPEVDPETGWPLTSEPRESPIPDGPLTRGIVRWAIRHFVDARRKAIHRNSNLVTTYRWDQSDVFYNTRKMLDAKGYDVSELSKGPKREKAYVYIKTYCDKLGIKRHSIGIFPADRAVMAYQGKTYSIGYENHKDLARNGVDIICVEKEGIVEKLAPFTKNVGIALIQSQGFVVEYGEMLLQEARHHGTNVMILTDFDSEGIKIASSIEGIERIGIDPSSIDEINILEAEDEDLDPDVLPDIHEDESVYKPDREDLEPEEIDKLVPTDLTEQVDESENWINLDWLIKGFKKKDQDSSRRIPTIGTKHERWYQNYLQQKYKFDEDGEEITYIDFLKDSRIELNTIMTEIGPKRFWNWLYSKIVETFPTRNYNHVIPIPPYNITLPVLDELENLVDRQIESCIENEVETIKDDLYQVKGFLNTDVKIEEIDEQLNDIVNEDEYIQTLNKKIKRFVKSLFKTLDNDKGT